MWKAHLCWWDRINYEFTDFHEFLRHFFFFIFFFNPKCVYLHKCYIKKQLPGLFFIFSKAKVAKYLHVKALVFPQETFQDFTKDPYSCSTVNTHMKEQVD